MTTQTDTAALKQIFLEARTHSKWQDKPVDDALLIQAWDLARMGPTSVNCLPARLVFVKSQDAKARLKPHLAPGNLDKTMTAPVTAIIGYDLQFYDHLPRLFPHADARSWFVGNDAMTQATAFRNSSLQAGYFLLALRALGLDCGPMSGFDEAGVNAEFFAGTAIRANLLINIGHGDTRGLYPRGERFAFSEVASIL